MLGIEVERSDGIGRGDEDEADLAEHFARHRLDHARELAERLVEQGLVGRVLVDILEHHPAAALFDRADRVLDRKAIVADRVGIDAIRQVAGIIFDAGARQPSAELDQRLERQERVTEQLVRQLARLLGIIWR